MLILIKNILSPYAYSYKKGLLKSEKYKNVKWSSGTIKKILSNESYLGNMVQNKCRNDTINNITIHTKKEDWIIVINILIFIDFLYVIM